MPSEIKSKFIASDMATDQEVQAEINKIFASPTFSGTPQAPTPPVSDNSNKIATTAFVKSALSLMPAPTVAGVFGNSFTFVEEIAETFTTSTTIYSNKLALTTPSLSLGNYIIFANYKFRTASNGRTMTVRLLEGVNVIKADEPRLGDAKEHSFNSMIGFLSNVSGVKNLYLQFKVGSTLDVSNTTAYISNASLVIWRVS